MKIIFKFFRNNKSGDFMTNLYLYLDYKNNLKFLKKKYNLGFFKKILYFKVNFHEDKKMNEQICHEEKFVKIEKFPDFKKEIDEIKENIWKKRINYLKITIVKYFGYFNIKNLIDLKNSQDNVKKIFDFLSRHITTYKTSIQELVEGQREVTQNKNFTFDDGETVQEKMDKFEKKLKEHLDVKSHIDSIKKNIKN
jgi:hypothetical protein